jgi:hypothetical protein
MMWRTWLKRSIVWLVMLGSILTIATNVTANAPKPPSLYWLKFDSPAKLQGVQIGQCYVKSCHKLELLKQYGTCDRTGCIKSTPKLQDRKPLGLECADNLCLVSLSPFYEQKELDPNRIRFVAQLEDRVFWSEIFPLESNGDRVNKFTVKAIDQTLQISPNPQAEVTKSSLFQDLFLFALLLTLGVELAIWAGYLRWSKVESSEVPLTIVSLLIVHAFSFAIVWLSFPGLEHFASDSSRYGGLTWLVFSIFYGIILSLHSIRAKKPFSKRVVIGSIAYWLGAAVFTLLLIGLSGYGSPVPTAAGLSEPMAIFLSEVFVVGYEAWIVQRLRRDTLSFKTALGVSLVANTASCSIGLAWAFFGSM